MVQKLIGRYCQLLSVIIVICLVLMVLMVFGNVVMRYAFNSGIAISEELSRWLFLWLIFLGASIAVHEQSHMGSDMVIDLLPPKVQRVAMVIGQLLMVWVTWLLLKGSWEQTMINWEVLAPVSELSMAWVYATGIVFSAGTGIMRPVAQLQARQGAQHRFGVIGANAKTQAHMGQLEFEVQAGVARDHAAHQHIAAATRVFG